MKFFKKMSSFFKFLKREDLTLREFAVGMSSEIDVRKDIHFLFLDYDEVSREDVLLSIYEVQQFWNLSDAFIYKTRNGYHAYFFYDHMPYSRVRQIIDYARYVDDKFRYISRYYDYKTIRQAGKYKVRDIVFDSVVRGKRQPTVQEAERGNMKRKEREALSNMHGIFNKDSLKD